MYFRPRSRKVLLKEEVKHDVYKRQEINFTIFKLKTLAYQETT